MRWAGCSITFFAILALAGCSGNQSALAPAGDQAARISSLWWLFFYVTGAIYVVVVMAALVAALKRKGCVDEEPVRTPDPQRERRLKVAVGTSVALTVLTLFVFLFADFNTGHAMHTQNEPNPLTIEVIGHRWWWEVRYKDPWPSNMILTANEIHVPVGKTVKFELKSTDVIHSFWAPNFNGKRDLIPGRPATNWFRATGAGEFRGQCAEYCGYQHAHMRFVIVAESQQDFDHWRQRERDLASAPSSDLQKRGQQVFEKSTCIMCHTISGTSAQGNVGPNLTHVASRKLLGAGSFSNTPEFLRAWIIDPQHFKPGALMPQQTLLKDDVDALVAYLGNLK